MKITNNNNTPVKNKDAQDAQEGEFNDLSVTTEISSGRRPSIDESHESSSMNEEDILLSERLLSTKQTPTENIVIMKDDNKSVLLSNYVMYYHNDALNKFVQESRQAITIATLNNNTLCSLSPTIHKRLSQLSLLSNSRHSNIIKLYLPMLLEGDFEFFDKFNWFNYNPIVKEQFNYMARVCEIMTEYTKLYYKKLEQFGICPEITLLNNNKGTLQKVGPILESQNQCTLTVINANSHDSPPNTKQRMQTKHRASQTVSSSRNPLLKHFQLNIELFAHFNYLKKLYPSPIQAYMIFEDMLNQAQQIRAFINSHNENPFFQKALKDQLQVTNVFMKFVELLFPYAINITKEFEIDLENDQDIIFLRNITKEIPDHLHEDFKIHQEFPASNKKPQKQSSLSLQPKPSLKEKNPSSENPQQISLEERQTIELTKAENAKLLKERKEKTEETTKQLRLAREEKKQDKGKQEAESKKLKAQEIVSQHKKEVDEKEQKDIEQRYKTMNNIPHLLSREQVNQIIASLSTNNKFIFNTIFCMLKNNDKVITDGNMKNCANFFQQEMISLGEKSKDEYLIECAKEFGNLIKNHKHPAHSSDSGDKMPINFLDAMRPYWILFGFFPENWEPRTPGDFDAMMEYHQRQLDELCAKNKNPSIETKV